jgi:hypothetical protein
LKQANGQNRNRLGNGGDIGTNIAHVHRRRERLNEKRTDECPSQIESAAGEYSASDDYGKNSIQLEEKTGMICVCALDV